jgi:diguanylate cyclase (GGDEF)-like protein
MQIINKKFSSISALSNQLDLGSFNKEKTLIQIFSGFVLEEEIEQIRSIIKKKNRDLAFIGTTTAGEIFEGEAFKKSIVVSIVEFEATKVEEGYSFHENDFLIGAQIASTLFTADTKAMILFVAGLQTNGSDLVEGISSVNSTIPLAGGLAGEDGHLKQTYVFDQNGVYSEGCVAMVLNSTLLDVTSEYHLNWQPIGKVMHVTKVEKNRLYEIDNMNVSEMYTKYLGENVGKNLPYSAIEFPLLKIDEDGFEICRTFTHQFEEDKSLLTIGNFKVGDKVRFSFGNIEMVLEKSKLDMKKYISMQPEILFVYSCAARKSLLGSKISQELLPLNKIATNLGFFTYGEIYHTQNKNLLLNESFTILALSEHPVKSADVAIQIEDALVEIEEKKIDNFLEDKHFLILDALTHLSNRVIQELEEAKEQLTDQSYRDFLTGLYNRRYFYELAKNFVHLFKRERKIFSIISIDIDKFKIINDTYGHAIGDQVIKALADILLRSTRKSDIVSRFGGEEFIILLPSTTKKGAYELAEKLRRLVAATEIEIDKQRSISFTISLGVDEIAEDDKSVDNVLQRSDSALYFAKREGRNRVVLVPDL